MLDLLVLGSGIAGLSAALLAAGEHGLRVGVVTKGSLPQGATRWAQGGVAAVLGDTDDSTDAHLADTVTVGVGLCDADAVRVLVDEGPDRVSELIELGARFDRDADGRLALGREGGHSASRVVHAGGAATGAEIERVLVDAVRRTAVVIHEHAFAVDLVVDGGQCVGVEVLLADGTTTVVTAANVLMATGGAGQLFAVTTNPVEATGDGVAMALRAGVVCADVEFVQFHPTALHADRSPRPLLTEALRGDGAVLRDRHGQRFVDELLPRDEVSRAMLATMLDQGVDHLWLDATGVEAVASAYPSITSVLAGAGLDPATDWLPVAPAAHYLCGGVVTDLHGATSLPGLWAAGEVACSGVHGANRLASNSLLEGLVFGWRAARSVVSGRRGPTPTGVMAGVLGHPHDRPAAVVMDYDPAGVPGRAGCDHGALGELQRAMTTGAGVLRSDRSLTSVTATLAGLAASAGDGSPAALEVANLVTVASAVVAAARARTESRGVHTRADYPDTDPTQAHRLVCRPSTVQAPAFDAVGPAGAG